jgi:hypothetical protein
MGSARNQLSKSELTLQVARYKGNDLPGFVSFITFKNIVNGHYLDGWRTVTKEHVRKMHRHLTEALTGFIQHAADPAARDVFIQVFGRFSRAQIGNIEETIQDIFEDESAPFTISRHYLDDILKERPKYIQRSSLPNEASTANTRDSAYLVSPSTPPQPSQHAFQNGDSAQPPPSRQPKRANTDSAQFAPQQQNGGDSLSLSGPQQQNNNEWNDDHTASEMIPCLLAYLTTARQRIVDKVLMETIERHMIRRITGYFQMLHKVGQAELACMLESPVHKRRREDLEGKIWDFENILNEL